MIIFAVKKIGHTQGMSLQHYHLMKTRLLLFVLMAVFVASCTKKKEGKSGNMIVSIPAIYDVQTKDFGDIDNFMSGIIAADKRMSHVYFFYELMMKCEPDYLLEYSVKGAIKNVTESSQWQPQAEKATFYSHDARKSNFTATFQGQIMNGVAYAFNDGKSRSYGVAVLYKGAVPAEDPVLKSFHLAKNTDKEVTYKDAAEEMQHFIEQIKPLFGQVNSDGIAINDMSVASDKKELTYTMGISELLKSDLSTSDLESFQNEMATNIPNGIKEMAASQPPLLRCMEEGYSIKYIFVDKNKEEICALTFAPEDYR